MVKNPPVNARDAGRSPESGRSPEAGNGNPLQYSCLGNPMDRGVWRATVHRAGKGRFSFQSQRKPMPKNVQTTTQLHSSHTLAK